MERAEVRLSASVLEAEDRPVAAGEQHLGRQDVLRLVRLYFVEQDQETARVIPLLEEHEDLKRVSVQTEKVTEGIRGLLALSNDQVRLGNKACILEVKDPHDLFFFLVRARSGRQRKARRDGRPDVGRGDKIRGRNGALTGALEDSKFHLEAVHGPQGQGGQPDQEAQDHPKALDFHV